MKSVVISLLQSLISLVGLSIVAVVVFPLVALGLWLFAIFSAFVRLLLQSWKQPGEERTRDGAQPFHVRVFHPFSGAGGGGEKVLYHVIRALEIHMQDAKPTGGRAIPSKIVLHTGDYTLTGSSLRSHVHRNFGINLQLKNFEIAPLRYSWALDSSCFPHVTLLLQLMVGVVGALDTLLGVASVTDILNPRVLWIDTMGCPGVYGFLRFLCRWKLSAYVHYPMISDDMVSSFREGRTDAVHCQGPSSRYPLLKSLKIVYYRFIVLLYKICGRFLDGGAVVNSSWTMGHMRLMWPNLHGKGLLALIHPPCFEMDDFRRSKKGVNWKRHALAHVLLHRVNSGVVVRDIEMISFISVGQFRPEKNHKMLIHSFEMFMKKVPDFRRVVRLKIVGSTRNERDEVYLASLQKLVNDLDCDDCISFHVNVSRDTLHKMLDESAFGVHTMWDEHFGISVVEYILSGCIPIAHRSGGPLLDIVKDDKRIGFLCETEGEYANRYEHCVTRLASEQARHMRLNGLDHIQQLFSSEAFECGMVDFLLTKDLREKEKSQKGTQ